MVSQDDAPRDNNSPSQNNASASSSDDNKNKPSRPLTREEQADLEFREFVKALVAEADSDASNSSNSSSGSKPSSASTSTSSSKPITAIATTARSTTSPTTTSPTTPPSITPDSLFPSEMSCREALDSAFFCQSPAGQWVNVYRYGTLKDCGAHWGAFWFCMRNKSRGRDERRRRVRAFYVEREAKYKLGPSSEDVWEARTRPVEGAFREDPGDGGLD